MRAAASKTNVVRSACETRPIKSEMGNESSATEKADAGPESRLYLRGKFPSISLSQREAISDSI